MNQFKRLWQPITIVILLFLVVNQCSNNQIDIEKNHKKTIKKTDSISAIAKSKIKEVESLNNELTDLRNQYTTVEKYAYKVSNDLITAKKATKFKVVKVKSYTNAEKQKYFNDNYGVSTNSVVHLDSVPAQNVIVNLEIGKGAILEVDYLTKIVKVKDSLNANLKSQNTNLETQKNKSLESYLLEVSANEINKKLAIDNFKSFKKEKNKKNVWKFATITAAAASIFLLTQ